MVQERSGRGFLQRNANAQQESVRQEVPSDVIDQDGPSTSNPIACTKLPTSIQYSMWVQAYLESSYAQSPEISDFSRVLVKSASND